MKVEQLIKPSLFIALLFWMANNTYSQKMDYEKNIKQELSIFFDGLNAKDTTRIKTTLAKEVSMKTLLIDKNEERLVVNTIHDFIQQVGRLGTLKIEERITNIQINVYYPLAIAGMDYEFYVDDELSHTGINIFEFAYIENEWKIIGISDSRQ